MKLKLAKKSLLSKLGRRAGSILEYAVFFTVFVAAIVLMSTYIKRGVQGNWHTNFSTMSNDLYDKDETIQAEEDRLHIKSEDYNLEIKQGASIYNPRAVGWVNEEGHNWQVWAK